VGATACGRVRFDTVEATDARTLDANGPPVAPPYVVQTAIGFDLASSVVVALSPTGADHLLVVAIATYVGVASVTDDAGDTYAVAQTQGDTNADDAELWYAKASAAGATAVTVELATSNNTVVWVIEVANMDSDAPLLDESGASVATSATTASGEPVPISIDDTFVVGVGAGGAGFNSLANGPEFDGLEIEFGDAAAYALAGEPGSYAPSWNVSAGAAWSISTAAFSPER
jgi:hypothetical protein